ncbi:MAG: hypothetical protein ACP5RT_02665 [Candidatus Micrarchaeia archaeon]
MGTAFKMKVQSLYEPVVAQVEGGAELSGNVVLSGFKHASNLVIAAAMLSTSNVTLHNIPKIADTEYLCNVAGQLGFEQHMTGTSLKLSYTSGLPHSSITLPNADLHSPTYLIAKLSVMGGGTIAGFGGCKIGDRFPNGAEWAARYFGVTVERLEDGGIKVSNNQIKRNPTINLGQVDPAMYSMAQKTAILFASVYGGKIFGIRRDQEIEDLLSMISTARISEIVSSSEDSSLSFYPSESKPVEFWVSPDPLEYITFLSALASSGGEISFNDLPSLSCITSEINALKYLGVEIDGKKARVSKNSPPNGTMRIVSPPAYSDALPIIGSAAATIPGASIIIKDNIWPKRKGYAAELSRIGCNITIGDSVEIRGTKVKGSNTLKPANLRDAAGALIASMGLDGKTTIYGLENLNRGYDNLIPKLVDIGARIWIKKSQ